MRMRLISGLAVLTIVPLAAACSTGPANGGSSSAAGGGGSTAADSSAFPVTIKTAFGPVTVKQKPTRVAVLGWGDPDIVAALGVAPIGAPKITWGGNGHDSTDWFDAQLKKIDGKQPTRYSDAAGTPINAVAQLAPDLIVATNSGITKTEFKKLSDIAPVVAYPGAPYGTSWQTSTTMIGKALGRSTQATKLIKTTEQKVDQATAKYPQIKGKTAAWLWFTPTDLSQVGVYTAIDNRERMLHEFGFKTPAFLTTLSKKSPNSFSATVSAEKAGTLDSDIAVFITDKKSQINQVEASPLTGKIPAIKRGTFVATTNQQEMAPMSSPTPLSIPYALTHLLPKLAAAAAK